MSLHTRGCGERGHSTRRRASRAPDHALLALLLRANLKILALLPLPESIGEGRYQTRATHGGSAIAHLTAGILVELEHSI